MKTHTTNYCNTFIEVADDCPVSAAAAPPQKSPQTIAAMQFEMISENPYKFSSDDIIFSCHAAKNDMAESEKQAARTAFFSKGQACLRSSPLAKRYGFGIHHNDEGKVAIFPVENAEYHRLVSDKAVKKVKAMRSKKA